MMATPPFRLLATSNEWCIGSAQAPGDCESVQFVSGIELEARAGAGDAGSEHEAPAGERLLMSYGINDCEAKLAKMPMDKVWAMLRPLKGEEGVCA